MRRPELLLLLLAACAPAATPADAPPADLQLAAAAQDAEARAMAALPAGEGRMPVMTSCLICHGAGIIVQQHKDAAGWTRTVRQMVAWGAPLPTAQEQMVAEYLAQSFGPIAAP